MYFIMFWTAMKTLPQFHCFEKKKKKFPVMFSKNDPLQSSFQSTTQKKALSRYYLIQY